MTPDELNAKFRVPGLRFDAGKGGLTRAIIDTPLCSGELYLHGAHVTAWQPRGHEPVIFTSANAEFAAGRAIRGGIPVCFPWFGDGVGEHAGKRPMHGFARTRAWEVMSADDLGNRHGGVRLTLRLTQDEQTRALWPGAEYEAILAVTFDDRLVLSMRVENHGTERPLFFEQLLHTYLLVSDVTTATVDGLGGAGYLDKTRDNARAVEPAGPLSLVEETDRVHDGTTSAVAVTDPAMGRRIVTEKVGSRSTVLWTPWPEKAAAIKLASDEWRRMICVEPGNVGPDAVTLGPDTVAGPPMDGIKEFGLTLRVERI